MTDAFRDEGLTRDLQNISPAIESNAKQQTGADIAPLDLSSIKVENLTPEERELCVREGLCLRCRENGHVAKNCPKCRRNRVGAEQQGNRMLHWSPL